MLPQQTKTTWFQLRASFNRIQAGLAGQLGFFTRKPRLGAVDESVEGRDGRVAPLDDLEEIPALRLDRLKAGVNA